MPVLHIPFQLDRYNGYECYTKLKDSKYGTKNSVPTKPARPLETPESSYNSQKLPSASLETVLTDSPRSIELPDPTSPVIFLSLMPACIWTVSSSS